MKIDGAEFVELGGRAVLCAEVPKRHKEVKWSRVNPYSKKTEKIDLSHDKYSGSRKNILIINSMEACDFTTYKASVDDVTAEIKLKEKQDAEVNTLCRKRKGRREELKSLLKRCDAEGKSPERDIYY
ncbi:uncharacterized protein LOC133195697 [Saccostrea echinata]|uniref:uncharacterized protein LOC133195697 n=1 Tax=Saccostrea echinata TaxID=191078 RepID=UPI002A7FF1E5|nr:uncharacterized protein LOC133195697 [Saccostrea echinata]